MTQGMLTEGRIPVTPAEDEAINSLCDPLGWEQIASFTRRDPGNTGPIVVNAHDGREWEISEVGQVKQVAP